VHLARKLEHLPHTSRAFAAGDISRAHAATIAYGYTPERAAVPRDGRTPTQRRADALVNICRRALDTGTVGGSRRVRPRVIIVVDLEHLGSRAPALVADLSRVITDGRSEILDVGRATRVISPALWKALVVRDRHCRAPGCDRPPGWCEALHLRHWSRGEATSLDNLVLLCWPDHRARHTEDARLPP
jgi:hypothetical protein